MNDPGPLDAEDIINTVLPLAFRGYAIGPVDELLARLADEVADRDRTIAGLRAAVQRLESMYEQSRVALADARDPRDRR
ncbi:MAG: hypothetical protein R3249_01205 [Nitriliruptorales bacterium]|nr:hypothetical protein [Nitriliruptorales bacterium]